jgi:hypothetical protein
MRVAYHLGKHDRWTDRRGRPVKCTSLTVELEEQLKAYNLIVELFDQPVDSLINLSHKSSHLGRHFGRMLYSQPIREVMK